MPLCTLGRTVSARQWVVTRRATTRALAPHVSGTSEAPDARAGRVRVGPPRPLARPFSRNHRKGLLTLGKSREQVHSLLCCDPEPPDSGPCRPQGGGAVTHRWVTPCLITSALLLTAGCTSSGSSDPTTTSNSPVSATAVKSTPPPATVTRSSSPAPGEDRHAIAANAAYLSFVKSSDAAERSPARRAGSRSLANYAIDPALGTAQSQLIDFGVHGIEWRGTPPSSRTRVTTVDYGAQPYPTVSLVDCPTVSDTWRPYAVSTGKPLKLVTPKVAPPWATAVTVVLYKSRWMVRTANTDMTRTCQP